MTLKKISLSLGIALYIKLIFFYILRTLIPLWRWFYFMRLGWLVSMENLKRHMYIVAGTKSGKTEFIKTLILRHIFRNNPKETVFYIEPHGDCSEELAKLKNHRKGDNFIYFFLGFSDQHIFCINPLDLGEEKNNKKLINFMAEHLTGAFQELITDSRVSANMRAFLTPIFYILLKRPDSTFLDFRRFLDDTQNTDLLEYARAHCTEGQKDFFYNKFNTSTYAPTKHALYIKIQELLNYESFYQMTIGKSTANIKDLMDSGKTVIFNLSKSDGEIAVKTFGRLLVSMIQGYGLARQDTEKSQRIPVYIYIDEFQNFVSGAIGEMLEELRKYGIHLILCHQHLKQITNLKLKESILTNAAIRVTGAVSGETLIAMEKVMTGASKEYIEQLDQGQFLVKVKTGTIWQKAFLKYAFVLRVTTSYLGHRYSMKSKDWEKVRKKQLQQFYKPLDGRTPDQSEQIEDIPAPEFQPTTQRRFSPFLPIVPIKPKFAL